ncbi:MAG: sugar nucleotide-binding protein [Desulfomonile tiedjei]|nr:sugar nucleotide-binding protein [Desulfomonile tiedjei]
MPISVEPLDFAIPTGAIRNLIAEPSTKGLHSLISSSASAPVTLVVGSDGLVGRALLSHLRRAGRSAVGTTRRAEMVGEACLPLDLSQDLSQWQCPFPVKVAVLCAGVTSLDVCRKNPENTELVNVRSLTTLARNLASQGAFVIFLSTNQVFDGSVAFRHEDDAYCPVTEYGRQKARAEQEIARLGNAAVIVRFTKILGPGQPLFAEWAKEMKRGHTIHPFSDMYFAPVPLSCAVSVLGLVSDRLLSGILQVSASTDLSYADAAFMGAEIMGVRKDLVQPVQAREKLGLSEPIPGNTTLNIDRIRSHLGIEPPDVRWTIQTAFLNPKALGGFPQD